MKQRIVIFGGTFDPVHYGHVTPILHACDNINATQLIYLPCHIPPHKQSPSVTSEHRLNIVKLLTAELNQQVTFDVTYSDVELRQQGHSFTRLSIEYFAQQHPQAELFFLIGMDSLLSFTSWHKWQEILQFCQLLVVKRPGHIYMANQLPKELIDKVIFADVAELEISSTNIRHASELSEVEKQLPKVVAEYIKQHKLYDFLCTR